jgi:hypothetical protein
METKSAKSPSNYDIEIKPIHEWGHSWYADTYWTSTLDMYKMSIC